MTISAVDFETVVELRGDRPSDLDGDGPARLLEREQVSAAVGDSLEMVRRGRGGALFVLGEAGLGKTAIAHQAASMCGDDVAVGWGAGEPLETPIPFGVLLEATRRVGAEGILAEGEAGAPEGHRRAARFYSVFRWLESRRGDPVVFVLDDLHWADEDSLRLLAFLARRVTSVPVGIIAMLRPWPAAAEHVALSLMYSGHARIERLAHLTPEASTNLLNQRVGRPIPDDTLERALALCAGNPLLLEQVAMALRHGDVVPWTAENTMSESSWRYVLLRRFAGLEPAAVQLAQAASVLGARFRVESAAEVAGVDGERDPAEALWRSGLVRQRYDGMAEFVHPLFAHAVYTDLSPLLRVQLHRRSFEVLVKHGYDTEAAEHAVRGHLEGDHRAVAVLTDVARRARRSGALDNATRNLRAAVDLAGSNPDASLILALARALHDGGHFAEAISVVDGLLTEGRLTAATRSSALRIRAAALWASGAQERAAAEYVQAVASAEGRDQAAAAKVEIDCAIAHWIAHGPSPAMPLADRARRLARGGQRLRSPADALFGICALQSGDCHGYEVVAEVAHRLLERSESATLADNVNGHFFALACFGLAAAWVGRFEEAERGLALAQEQAERFGIERDVHLRFVRSVVLWRCGRLAAALASSDEALARIALMPELEPYVLSTRSHLLLELGRVDEAQTALARAEDASALPVPWWPALQCAHLRGLCLLREGRVSEASDEYRRTEELARHAGLAEPCVVPFGVHAVRAHVRARRLDDARRVAEWLEQAAPKVLCPWTGAAAVTARATLLEGIGDLAEALECYRAAFARLDEVELPIERVEALLDFAAMLGRSSRLTAARAAAAEALRLAERQGAVWLADRAHAQLVAVGGRRRRTREDPFRLTPQEEKVARLAAAGATNQQIAMKLFLSPTTVKWHLQRIFTKLGIHSRRELMLLTADTDPAHGSSGRTQPVLLRSR